MRALIVEDDEPLRRGLVRALREAGWVVDEAADGHEGFYQASEFPVDVAVIDLGLPGLSGMDLIGKLREAGHDLPIVILTARDRWQDKVAGLKAGADDYMVKPFHPEELIARMQALVRRAGGWAQPVINCGSVSLDTRSQQVLLDGDAVELTTFEYRLLECLMLHAGEVVSKTVLTERLYAQDFDRDSNTIEVFIGRLRRKLDPDGIRQPIETLRGRGYRMVRGSAAGGTS